MQEASDLPLSSSRPTMSHRPFKDTLYEQFARVGNAISSPKRIEILDLLGQSEKTVEELADGIATPLKNTSAHLRTLRQARLVETRRNGTRIFYRLADHTVSDLLRSLQALANDRLTEVAHLTQLFVHDRDALQPVTLKELKQRLRDGSATIVDVRPRAEFDAGHIPGAISVPVDELRPRLKEISKRKEIIAYCRGPYCLYSLDAVTLLRKHGYKARRAEDGLPGWRGAGLPVAVGAD